MASNQSLHHAVEPSDINKLQAQLNSIAGIWDLFVGQLGVPRSKQQQISRNNTNHPAYAQICLQDGLQYWVESDPLPTVEKIIAALSSEVINNKPLAAEIGRQWGVQVAVEVPALDMQSVFTAASQQPAATMPDGQTSYDTPHAKAKIFELKRKFISLVGQLKHHLKATLTDAGLPKFRDEFILQLPLSITDENEKFFNRRNAEINKATTFDELFTCLSTHWNYLSHSLLGGIITVYGTEENQRAFKEFCKDVEKFRKFTTIAIFGEIEQPPKIVPPAGFEEFVTRHALSLTSTLEDIECIRLAFSEKFHLHKIAFYLVRVLKGSVIITWLVPHSVARLVEAEVTQELMRDLCIEDIIYTDDNSENKVQSNVQAAAVALNPQVKWEGFELHGTKHYGAFGDRDVLLIASEARLPEAVSHTPPPQLSEDERAGYLTSQGVPPDCPLDDLHIMKARYELDKRYEIAGEEQSTFEHPLTTSYVKSKIASVFKKTKKSGVELHYHGPGRKGTGDWCFADGFITFQDITDLYMENFMGSVLVIHTDCSYSGSWVKSCGEFLDKQGVQPCGHSAHDKGILIKLRASCRDDEVAQSLYYSTRVWQNDKNTRTLYYTSLKAEDPQHRVLLNSTHIRCDNKTIEQPCTLPPDLTWQKQLAKEASDEVKKRVYIVRRKDGGRPRWHYVLLPDNKKETKEAFLAQHRTGHIDVADYGKVLKSGRGEDPPMEVREWFEKEDFTKYL